MFLCAYASQQFSLQNLENCEVQVLDHSETVQVDVARNCKIFIGELASARCGSRLRLASLTRRLAVCCAWCVLCAVVVVVVVVFFWCALQPPAASLCFCGTSRTAPSPWQRASCSLAVVVVNCCCCCVCIVCVGEGGGKSVVPLCGCVHFTP